MKARPHSRRKRLRDVSFRILRPLYRGFSLFGKKKTALTLALSNSSSIKAFRVSSAASSKFRLIDMVCRISGIHARKYCTSVADKLWYSEHARLTVLTSYPASVVVVRMYYRALLRIGVLWNHLSSKPSDIRMTPVQRKILRTFFHRLSWRFLVTKQVLASSSMLSLNYFKGLYPIFIKIFNLLKVLSINWWRGGEIKHCSLLKMSSALETKRKLLTNNDLKWLTLIYLKIFKSLLLW